MAKKDGNAIWKSPAFIVGVSLVAVAMLLFGIATLCINLTLKLGYSIC